ncbi:hypothetical protein ACOMHN_049814 [Nucella lapillus]
MSGVRVQNIDPQFSKKLVWQYFADLCGRTAIEDVYYPLLNNNAVVIFRDPSAMTRMLTSKHEKWTVLPLPNQVFSKHRVWLEADLTRLLQDQEQYQQVLKDHAQIDISMDKTSKQIMLTGQSYQIEWAWRYLSNLQDQQQHSSGFFRSAAMSAAASPQPNGDTLTNGDIHSPMHGSARPGHSSHAGPRLHNGSVVSVSDATSPNIESVSGRRRLPSPRSGSSDVGPDRGKERSGATPAASDVTSLAIKGLNDERQGSSPSSSPGFSGVSPRQKERSPQDPVSKTRTSPPSLTYDDEEVYRAPMAMGGSGVSPRQKERSPQDPVSKTRTSPPSLTYDDEENYGAPMAMGGSGQGVPSKNLISQAGRHTSATDVSAYTSLPFNNLGAAHISREQASSPSQNAGRHSQRSPRGVKNTDLDQAEVIYRAPGLYQSLSCQPPLSQDKDYGAVGGGQSSAPFEEGQGEDNYYDDMEGRGAYAGPRAFSSLPYTTTSSSLRLPTNTKLALLNRSVVELSRKHFDMGQRLKLKIYKDDITRSQTDAVVSAANWELKNIGGVAGALARAAGPEMEAECQRIYREKGPLKTAQVVKTKAYGRLNHLKYVLHTVGPVYRKDDPDKCVFELAQTFLNCLSMAENLNLQSITFPFISAGIFAMPIEHCVLSLITALKKHSHERFGNLATLEEVHFINHEIDVVCNAVLCAERTVKLETAETSVKRMEQGQRVYSRSVFPFCEQNTPPARTKSSSTSDESYATWDSGADRGATEMDPEVRGQHRSRQRSDKGQMSAEPQSMTVTDINVSGHRTRSRSFDRGSRTVTAASGSDTQTSSSASGRDPSPMPRSRSRSGSLSNPSKGGSGAVAKSGSSSASGGSAAPKTQPVIKPFLVPAGVGNKKRSMGLAKSLSRGRTSDQSGNDTDPSSAAASETEDPDKTCPICLDDIKQAKKLACGHSFCAACVDKAMAISRRCPKCQRVFGVVMGTQPSNGTMNSAVDYRTNLAGYTSFGGTIIITYDFPPGRQEACHPNPGQHYGSTHRVAYLPNTLEGQEVLKMLQRAFDKRLVFTIGDSVTTGARGVITWNDIHHKTSTYGGPSQFGYPDPNYLFRVKEELAAKGITHP